MSEIIFIILLLISILTVYCLYKMLEKRGLYFSLILMNIFSLVLTFKVAYVFKMNINLGILPFLSSLMIIYLFITKYGDKEQKNLFKICLYSNIITATLLIIMNYYVAATTETISINMQGTFEYNYKILIIYPIMAIISQISSIKLYKLLSQIQNNNILSIMLTYVITGLIYTALFDFIIYLNIIEISSSLFIGVSTYIIGLPLMLIYTIFINYINKKKQVRQ